MSGQEGIRSGAFSLLPPTLGADGAPLVGGEPHVALALGTSPLCVQHPSCARR